MPQSTASPRTRCNRSIKAEWRRPLEEFVAATVLAAHPDAVVKEVAYDPSLRRLSIVCHITPNPCAVAHHRHADFHLTKLVVERRPRGRHKGFWTCCGFGEHRCGAFDASHLLIWA